MTAPRSSRGQRQPAASVPVDVSASQSGAEPSPVADGADERIQRSAAGDVDGGEIQGVELASVRTGDDTRRRGWFWHWNSIVTQYAPLIGLKGVGLLNSYTVWTDRRESSPMRGYAFPSQQSEADFYGEDRAELIAINKILVALDLIEIKKEMVLRVDEHGHRWRVPHNLYRVKDTDDSRGLTTADVLRVTELAERDAAVYRYLRRVFSARFSPIDPANVWHTILPEVRQDPAWQRLAAKTAREEERFSARSRAGHANRRAGAEHAGAAVAGIIPITGAQTAAANDGIAATGTDASHLPRTGDTPAAETTVNDTTGDGAGGLRATSVATSNVGLSPDVAASNRGLGPTTTTVGATAVERSDQGRPSDVAPSNTIEDQFTTTTTTTYGADETDDIEDPTLAGTVAPPDTIVRINRPVTATETVVTSAVTSGARSLAQTDSGADGGTENEPAASTGDADAPLHGPGDATVEVGEPLAGSRSHRRGRQLAALLREDEALALTAFEAANGGRVATPAEVQILRQIAGQLDAVAATDPELTTGWAWLGAAVYEAVDAGSAYVAPRRIREIVTRWQREGRPGAAASGRPPGEPASDELPATMVSILSADRSAPEVDAPRGGAGSTDARRSADRHPGGGSGRGRAHDRSAGEPRVPTLDGPALWDAVLQELARDMAPDRLAELAEAVVVTNVTSDEVQLTAPSANVSALAGELRPLLTRALSAVLRRTVRLTIRPADAPAGRHGGAAGPVLERGVTSPEDAWPRDASRHVPSHARRAVEESATTAFVADHVTPQTDDAPAASPDVPSRVIASPSDRAGSLGLTDAHLWAAIVDEVVRAGDVTAANMSAWLKPARIAGRTPAGGYVVVAASDIARRRLDGPLRPALETALARVLGPGAMLEITTRRSG